MVKKKSEAEDKEFRVSQSKVKTYRRCRRAYHNKYVEKLRKKVKSRPLQFGTLVHAMLEADAEGDDPMEALKAIEKSQGKMFAVEKEMYGEILDDIRQIMTAYFEYWPEKDLRYERKNGKSGEHEFNIELYEYQLHGVVWNGKIDRVGKTPNKLRWIVEHKTFSRKPSDDDRWRNLQSSTYIRALDIMGWGSVDGMCWDYIRSKSPTRPALLKDGSLSEKNIDTLPITVRETIAELNLKLKDYKGLMQRTEEQMNYWFQRIHTPVQSSVVDILFEDFISTIREMRENHGKCKEMNIDRHCGWCDFEGLCRAELQGNDVDFIKQKDYYRHDKDEYEPGLTDSTD